MHIHMHIHIIYIYIQWANGTVVCLFFLWLLWITMSGNFSTGKFQSSRMEVFLLVFPCNSGMQRMNAMFLLIG